MALILSIESAAMGCSVALHRNGDFLAERAQYESRSAAEQLTVLTERLLKESGFGFSDLDAIAVSKGPGSYTGLRIGVSTAKGLCYATDLPLISINTLDALACDETVSQFDGLLCPMLDARRMEVYCKIKSGAETLEETSAVILANESFNFWLEKHPVLFFGDGAAKFKEVCDHSNAHFADGIIAPKAKNIGLLAYQKYLKNEFEDVAEFEPYYLKEFMMTTPKKNKKVVA